MKFLKKTIFRRTSLLSKVRQEEKYLTVAFYEKKGKPVVLVCQILDLNRSSYYKWKNRVKPAKEIQDELLCDLITEYDITFKHTLGYRRMTLFINRLNKTKHSNQYIHRLMKHLNVKSLIRRCKCQLKNVQKWRNEIVQLRRFSFELCFDYHHHLQTRFYLLYDKIFQLF